MLHLILSIVLIGILYKLPHIIFCNITGLHFLCPVFIVFSAILALIFRRTFDGKGNPSLLQCIAAIILSLLGLIFIKVVAPFSFNLINAMPYSVFGLPTFESFLQITPEEFRHVIAFIFSIITPENVSDVIAFILAIYTGEVIIGVDFIHNLLILNSNPAANTPGLGGNGSNSGSVANATGNPPAANPPGANPPAANPPAGNPTPERITVDSLLNPEPPKKLGLDQSAWLTIENKSRDRVHRDLAAGRTSLNARDLLNDPNFTNLERDKLREFFITQQWYHRTTTSVYGPDVR